MKLITLTAAASVVLLLSGLPMAFSQETREVKKTVDLNKDGEVSIDTYKGSITIHTWDKPQVEVNARIEPDGHDRYSKEKVRDTEIDIDGSTHNLYIKSDYEDLKSHSSWLSGLFGEDSGALPFVHYTISMPATARLRIKDYKSESRIEDLKASLEINTYKGTVNARRLEGSIDLDTYKGEVTLDYASLKDDSRLKTYKGRIELSLPKDASFTLDTEIGRHGDFDSDFSVTTPGRLRHHDRSHGSVGSGGPLLEVNNEKGTVRLRAK